MPKLTMLVRAACVLLGIAPFTAGKPSLVSTDERCFTSYVAASPSSTFHRTLTSTTLVTGSAVITSISTSTSTPAVYTETDYTTETDTVQVTQLENTDTFYSTTTSYFTEYSTNVEVDTSTITSTTSTTQYISNYIPTVSGFVPIASEPSVENAGGGQKKSKRSAKFAQDYVPVSERRSINDTTDARGLSGLSPVRSGSHNRYVRGTKCFKDVYKTTVLVSTTASTTTVTAPTPTSTFYVTQTEYSTHTISPPDASTTSTLTQSETTTSIVYSTSMSTETTTSTVVVSVTRSAYAACATDSSNLISQVGGKPLYFLDAYSGYSFATVPDLASCCSLCQSQDGSAGSTCGGFSYFAIDGSVQCYLENGPDSGATCDPSRFSWGFEATAFPEGVVGFGNGPCGQGAYEGALL